MTRYQELKRRAESLTKAQCAEYLMELGADERFAAVVGLIEQDLDGFGQAASSQALSDSHGKQSHACGSAHALRVLAGQIAGAIERRRRSAPPESPPDGR